MIEFKGTKGKWMRVKYESTLYSIERNEVQFGNDGECVAEFVHDDYDAQLISKAPEMLEMLKTVIMELEVKGQGNLEVCGMVKKLIKESITI